MAAILNQSFSNWSAHHKYPFTDGSDMTCTDGRRIPLSYVVDAGLYPPVEGDYWISSIDRDGITVLSSDGWTAFASFTDYKDGWVPVMKDKSPVGSIVINEDDYPYVSGLASVAPMTFRQGHLQFVPGVVRSFCLSENNITPKPTFFGVSFDTLSVDYDSARYSVNQDGTVDFDLAVTVVTEHQPITEVSINGVRYALADNGHLNLRTPIWCDDQFISEGNGIILHRRGA